MNYSGVKFCDIANGLGVRTVLFVSGCRNHCEGCFQPETWDFSYGKKFDDKVQDELLQSLEPDYVKGLTLLGGDPFEPENQKELLPFLKSVKDRFDKKDIWAYTGYILDKDLMAGGKCYTEDTEKMLDLIDVLVDGPFILKQKDMMLKFRGSVNQRIIDMIQYRRNGQISELVLQ